MGYFQLSIICRSTFFNLVKKIADDILKADFVKLLDHLRHDGLPLNDNHIRNLIYGDYAKPDDGEKNYDEITDLNELSKIMET